MSLLLLVTTAAPLMAQDSVRVMTYNLLRYGAQGIGCTPTGVTTRNPWLSGILNLARPDIFGVNEMGPYTGPTSPSNNMLVNILQPINPAYRATTITYNGSQDVTNMMYYNSDKVGLAWQAVIPEPTLTLRGDALPAGLRSGASVLWIVTARAGAAELSHSVAARVTLP